MGDKTQIATISLAARFHTIVPVAAGTTLGSMMIANIAAVFSKRAGDEDRAGALCPHRRGPDLRGAGGRWTLIGAIRG